MKHSPKEYLAVRLWGRDLGSYDYYINDEQQRASVDGAPVDAIYREHGTGKWVCVSDLQPDHSFRARYRAMLDATP